MQTPIPSETQTPTQSLSEIWGGIIQIPEARWIVLGTLLLFALMIAIYVSFFFRDLALGSKQNETDNFLGDFRKMREEGQLDETEFSRLKSKIPDFKEAGWSNQENNNHHGKESNGEKQFLTLAEAQQMKQRETTENTDEEE